MRYLALLGIAAASFATASIAPVAPSHAQEVAGSAAVTGAGSTFAFPIVTNWAHAYRRWVGGIGDVRIASAGLEDPPTGPVLDYEPLGSLGGIMRVKERAVDFGASDMPLPSDELKKLGLVQFPVVIGGIVPVVNIDGVAPGAMRFSGEVLANIFLGKIDNWSDPAIKALNPNLKLPDAKIAIVHRSDGSGTTFNFTNYLSKVSDTWRTQVGSDLLVRWPVGSGARGNNGVAQTVTLTKNSIGYVEFASAVINKLSWPVMQNRAGKFVTPEAASFQAAAASAEWAKAGDFNLLLTDAPGENAYPIVATVFALIPTQLTPSRVRSTLNFFQWSLDNGQGHARELGYVPLPPELVTQVKSYWQTNYKFGS